MKPLRGFVDEIGLCDNCFGRTDETSVTDSRTHYFCSFQPPDMTYDEPCSKADWRSCPRNWTSSRIKYDSN